MELIIVESPHKAKTIEKFLGGKYKVDASKGHVRDLPVNHMGVSIAHNFEPTYVINPDKKQDIKRLMEKAKKAEKARLGSSSCIHSRETMGKARSTMAMQRAQAISRKNSFLWGAK